MGYGHGDVIHGQDSQWSNHRNPWTLSFEGDKIYGRGTADNKGQHLAHISAIKAILNTRGKLGFNHRFIIEMGEENGSLGFRNLQEIIGRSDLLYQISRCSADLDDLDLYPILT